MYKWLSQGGKADATIISIIQYVGEFLTFCQHRLKDTETPTTSSIDIMLFIIKEKRSLFETYRQAMEREQQKPATLKKRILALQRYVCMMYVCIYVCVYLILFINL